MTNKLDGLSLDLEATNKAKLQTLFPECFTEGSLDIDKLLSLCGEYIDNDFEKYKFEWKGKSECLRLAQKRSSGTLRPCREESVDFDNTQNLYIEGDNLEVLKLLQTAYFRRVKMIYIDPPYNTGNDFVYEDDYKDPMARYKEVTAQTTKSNPETMGRFHTNWLNMMYPRLRLAANLLRDDGVIFISIDDAELYNLKKVTDEVFGEENYVATLVYDKNRKNDAKYFSVGHEYMLVYFKNASTIYEAGTIFRTSKVGVDEVKEEFVRLKELYKDDWKKINQELKVLYASWPDDDERKPLARFTKVDDKGPYRDDGDIGWPGGGGPKYDVIHPVTGNPCKIPDAGWRFPNLKRMQEEIDNGRIAFGADETTLPRIRRNLFESDTQVMRSVGFSYAQTATQEFMKIFDNRRIFDNPKSISDIKKLVGYITMPNDEDIVMDFFSGSATTAHAVMQLNAEDGGNRKFICVQLPEITDKKSEAANAGFANICEIGKERIRRSGTAIKTKILESAALDLGIGFVASNLSDEMQVEFDKKAVLSNELDIGFKVFKLDTSNLREWDSTPIENENLSLFYQRINQMVDSIKPDRTDMDVVYEVMLKMGMPLDVPVSQLEIGSEELGAEKSSLHTPNSKLKKPVYVVGDLLLLICMAENLTAEDVTEMASFAPGKIILAEQSFVDDSALSNAHYILRDKQIELKLV